MMDVRTIVRQLSISDGFGYAWDNRPARRARPLSAGADRTRPKGLAAKRKARRKMAHESRRRNRWK